MLLAIELFYLGLTVLVLGAAAWFGVLTLVKLFKGQR